MKVSKILCSLLGVVILVNIGYGQGINLTSQENFSNKPKSSSIGTETNRTEILDIPLLLIILSRLR